MSKKKTSEPVMTEETFSDAMDEAMEQAIPDKPPKPEPEPEPEIQEWIMTSTDTGHHTWEEFRNLKLTS